jgi:hypothetical protein
MKGDLKPGIRRDRLAVSFDPYGFIRYNNNVTKKGEGQ